MARISIKSTDIWKNRPTEVQHINAPADRYHPRGNRILTSENYSPQTPPRHQGETAQQMPNYDLLTPFEQKLYEVLPGFSESTVGKALQRFSESWAGKALGYLDVFAEGAERLGGVASQFWRASSNPEELAELQSNLNSAWYAGSLAGDMTNLPTFDYDEAGRVRGISIPDDLPGAAGIADARNQITALVDQGYTHSEALQQVKGGYYDNLGALQIRAQLYDLYTHVLADPLNYVMPAIKPLERTKALAYFAGSHRWADDAIDAARAASKALAAGDLNKFDEVADFAKATRLAGSKLDELNKVIEAKDAAKLTGILDNALKDVGMNTRERIALYITGGKDPFKVSQTKWEKLYDKMPWRLTPESRAYEFVTVLQDNVGSHIVQAYNTEDDIVNALIRASSGAVGGDLGHAFLTVEGRAVQAALRGFEAEAVTLLNQVKGIVAERELLADIASLVGRSEEELMGIMKGGDFSTVSRLTDGAFAPEQLETLFAKLDGLPYTTRLFKFKLMNKLADRTAKQGALMFGVKQRGFVQKLAQAVKSAETLAFLRINPGYMIRNVLNNEVTMIARGAGLGWNDLRKAGEYFGVDFDPFRFGQGFGAIGDTFAHPADVASEVLGDVLTGEAGSLDKFSRRLNDINIPLDMGAISAKMEANASKRAFTTSYIRGWNKYFWKPGTGFDELGSYLPTRIVDEIRAVDEGLIPTLEKFVASSRTPQELKAKVFSENLNININSIIDEASAKIGYDITESVPPEIIASFRDGLEEAAKQGRIPSFMDDLRAKQAAIFDEATPEIVKKIRNEVAEQVKAEGPQAFPKILSDAMDETYNLGIYHARREAELAEIARSVAPDNPELAHQLWKQMYAEADSYYSRDWQRLDSVIQGFKKGVAQLPEDEAKALGRIADEAIENFRVYRNGWKKFWKSKRTRGDAYWEPVRQGKKPKGTWEDVAAQTSKEYNEMIVVERGLQEELDQIVARSIPDDAARKRYLAGQADLREYIFRDKEKVSELFDKMKLATADEREALYQELVTERFSRIDAIRNKQRTITRAMEGDPEAVTKLDQVAAVLPPEDLALKPDIDYLKVSRSELPPEVSEAMELEAASLQNWLEGSGVERIPGEEPDTFIRASSNPEWYLELYRQGFTRKQVEKSLERVLVNKGKDIAKANETALPAVKDMIMNRLISGEEMPPHPATLLFFNMEDEAAQAIGQYLTDPTWAKTATDEDWIKLVGDQESLDRLLTRLDEINEGLPPKPSVEELARRDLELAEELGGLPPITKEYVSDYKHLKRGVNAFDPPEQLAADEWWLTRGFPALDEIEKSAMAQATKPELRWANLPDEAKQYLNNYIEHVSGQMGDARYASTRFAEFGRDAALLNYNRRYNYNTWLGTIMPYEFWTTHSMMKWAIHSIDRPAMLTSYLRIQEFMNTAGAPNQALPKRLKGQFRIPMPFLPDWAGDHVFFDPLRSLLPIQNFTYGYEEEMQRMSQLEGKTEYIINDMVENGEIRPEEAEVAILEKRGDLWDKAQQMAIDDDEELAFNTWDFVSLLSSPHAPLDWAVKTLEGRTEDIGPFTPASRTIKGVAGLLGVDWNKHPMNLEGRLRKQLGLPAFDKWDDYRIDRMLSNMTAMGETTAKDALRAMIDREGEAYDMAVKKSNYEFGIGAVGSTFGIPSKAYPEGEFLQRSLQDDFNKAVELRDAGDPDALQVFFDLHPEYETKLALWKEPEERLRSFLVDDMWNIWHDLPKLHKDQIKDQFGDEFYTKFLNSETRSYDSIELDELQTWLKLMGGDPPGSFNSEPAPIDLADPEVAWRVQVFYETRWQYFPEESGVWEDQDKYFDVLEKQGWKAAQKHKTPILAAYWDWKRDWLHRNPETVPYLTEKDYEFKYSSPQAEQRAQQLEPWMTWDEWRQHMGPSMTNLMEDHFLRDYEIPDPLQNRIDELAEQLGLGYSEALGLMEESLALR